MSDLGHSVASPFRTLTGHLLSIRNVTSAVRHLGIVCLRRKTIPSVELQRNSNVAKVSTLVRPWLACRDGHHVTSCD